MITSLVGFLAVTSLMSSVRNAPVVHQLPPVQAVSSTAQAPQKRDVRALGVETTNQSAFVADIASGKVLYAKNPHQVLPIASLTKLMTTMVYLDSKPDLSKPVTFEEGDFDNEGETVFQVGETMTQGEALKALLIGSVNASANALARVSLGRDAFIKAMNEKVKSLGLSSPVFVEPTGLDPQNRADAADVAAMLSIAASYPQVKDIASTPEVDIHGSSGKDYHIKSTNLLLTSYLNHKPYRIIAAKTGSLPEAGYCMAQITSDANGHQIVVASLNSANHFARFQDVKVLTAWTFKTFDWK